MVMYDGSELDDQGDDVPEPDAPDPQFAALHAFLDAVEDAGLPLPYPLSGLALQAGFTHSGNGELSGRTGLARLLRASRRAGFKIRKGAPSTDQVGPTRDYYLDRPDGEQFGYIYAPAALTCERVQTGVRFVERPVFAPVPEPVQVGTETIEEPVYEWRCRPTLAPETSDADAAG